MRTLVSHKAAVNSYGYGAVRLGSPSPQRVRASFEVGAIVTISAPSIHSRVVNASGMTMVAWLVRHGGAMEGIRLAQLG